MNLQEILRQHSQQLAATLELAPVSARIEVQCLLQAALQVNRAYLLARPEMRLDARQSGRYTDFYQRRLNGEPIAYILGEREFFGLNFKVSEAVLIPRPDTELLVELALARIPTPLSNPFRVLDLGTGSGAIALSIAHARPDIDVTAVDRCLNALQLAEKNRECLNIPRLRLLCSDWFSALGAECFELIISNPPYIAQHDAHLAQGDLRFEPRTALASGLDGLDDLRRIITSAHTHLVKGGWLLLEHGHDQACQVRELLREAGFSGVCSERDLAGTERVSGGTAAA